MAILGKTNKILVVCPICKTRDIVGIPPSRLNKNSQLTTISVHKGLICPHHFQFFMDNNFQIRGYQKVDLELNQENSKTLRNGVKAFNIAEKKKNDLFKSLILDGDEIKYHPLNGAKNVKARSLEQEIISKKKKMTSKEIYEEFWEFIDETNELFHEFIIKDIRRQKSIINAKMSECITI
ncbi:MAG: hypothetical protein JSV62_04740 [Promethearchaeota archaeon]|nr:MAG: hypothetical protein JSV62_04740 [Candidatus Lokiarchaeota archaeon]